MTIPASSKFLQPVLGVSSNGEIKLSDAVRLVGDEFKLSAKQRAESIPSGRTRIWIRVKWAINELAKVGLVERTRYGHFKITEKGKKTLSNPPRAFNSAYIAKLKKNRDTRKPDKVSESPAKNVDPSEDLPEERMLVEHEQHENVLVEELLEKIREIGPHAFEKLNLSLMKKMGYGSRGDAKWTGKGRDGGIDGIVYEDSLGLDTVYLQAKHYKAGKSVGQPDIDKFVGALGRKGVTKGIFITFGNFARGVSKSSEITADGKKIILIDGSKLARLMIKHGVGVRERKRFVVNDIDTGFFDEIEN